MKRVVLVAGMGTSPAVLTETVWALAHQSPAIIPDEIVVLVTKSGKEKLYKEILSGRPTVWDQMCDSMRKEKIDLDGRLIFGDTSIRVIPDERGNGIADLRSGEDNLRAADFMLQQLRQYTETSDTVVITSIAGGRKTMSALLFSCMTLLGREDDKVFHVLLPPEFEGGVFPPMYYPVKGVTYTNRFTGKKYKSDKFHSELFEVPFVRMRGWYQEKFKTIPPSYRTLISKIQTVSPPAVAYPEIEIDAWNGWVTINGQQVSMSRPCFALLLLLSSGVEPRECHQRLLVAHKASGTAKCDWLASFQEGPLFRNESDTEDIYKTMSNLRGKLKSVGFADVETLVPQRGKAVMFPISRIKWRNARKLVDICGCLISEMDD
ncbi:MAG: TIGR02584 family CRISPR-associated protein [Prevotella sp.]|nr:TIGR02584 family CRISPR-associated protein [Prevotella sp.]